MNTSTDFWFTIEPYIHVNIAHKCSFLYNTLDGATIESDKDEVINLLQETLQKDNCGVVLLTNERYQQKDINAFIRELREKYMGDVIEVSLSKGKPVQLLPYFNFMDKWNKKYSFSGIKNILDTLCEISIHIDHTTDVEKLILLLKSIPENITFNIIGNIGEVQNCHELLSFFDQHPAQKNIVCACAETLSLEPVFKNNFSYSISVKFPLNMQQWNNSLDIVRNQTLPYTYVFDVSSNESCQQAEQVIKQFRIEKYRMRPVYTGDNIVFFEENVFLTKEDILSAPMSIKDFFYCQAINKHDFGKLHIMPSGEVYANILHPVLGNIYTDGIYKIVEKEMEAGKSWFRIRNQAPCNDCIYQWICPSPSNYEITIGRPNLCQVKQL